MDQSALFKISYGLYVLSTSAKGRQNACIINATGQITMEPLLLTATVSKGNLTRDMILASNTFCLAALRDTAPLSVIGRFGYASGRDKDKFAGFAYATDGRGNPYPISDVVATYTCTVRDLMDFPTHTMFIAEIEDAVLRSGGKPMTYDLYRDLKTGNAATACVGAESQKKATYTCSLCHYVYDGDIPFEDLPEDYVCLVCGAGKSAFIKG